MEMEMVVPALANTKACACQVYFLWHTEFLLENIEKDGPAQAEIHELGDGPWPEHHTDNQEALPRWHWAKAF